MTCTDCSTAHSGQDRHQNAGHRGISAIKSRFDLNKITGPLLSHLFDLCTLADELEPWYLGGRLDAPHQELAGKLDLSVNSICPEIKKLSAVLQNYIINKVEIDGGVINSLCSSANDFLDRMRIILPRYPHYQELYDSVGMAQYAVFDRFNSMRTTDAIRDYLTMRFKAIEDAFTHLCEAVRVAEQNFPHVLLRKSSEANSNAATKADVDAAAEKVNQQIAESSERTKLRIDTLKIGQDEIGKTIKRIDKRMKKANGKSRLKFSVEMQEVAFNYWETGKKNAAVRQMCDNKKKPTFENVFSFYKRELTANGIATADQFRQILSLRQKRISKKNCQRGE